MNTTAPAPLLAKLLNQQCDCIVMDDALLQRAFASAGSDLCVADVLRDAPHLFARSAVFVDRATTSAMRAVVDAVERVTALPAYIDAALKTAADSARVPTLARGACLGFDFHLADDGPQLIEINTNAGGALLNVALRKAQRMACEALEHYVSPEPQTDLAELFYAMFAREFSAVRGPLPLRAVAIVDDAPEKQFLYQEFKLYESLFRAHGLTARITDPSELALHGGKLWHEECAIDLVYNRVTDFSFAAPEHAQLAEAHRTGAAVITPHPRAHALYADKRRLCTFSSPAALTALGASGEDAELLARHVPRTIEVTPDARERLWEQRRSLFFKPHSGFGSKAAYRGDKLTKSVFERVLSGGYVAQALVGPSSRTLCMGDVQKTLKLDVRCFAYAGEVQLVCARLYSGQTTNFRTQGGGFAPVYETLG